jgi:hypothetical protein
MEDLEKYDMEIGFNKGFPIIATVLNSMRHEDRYPIVHLVVRPKYSKDDTFTMFLDFDVLSRKGDEEKVEYFKFALIKFFLDNSAVRLPLMWEGKFHNIDNTYVIPGKKYSILPTH